jgi:hypothetical protein
VNLVLLLLLLITFLLNGHMVSDGTPGDRPHNGMMVREVTGDTANDSTLQTSRSGGRDIYAG